MRFSSIIACLMQVNNCTLPALKCKSPPPREKNKGAGAASDKRWYACMGPRLGLAMIKNSMTKKEKGAAPAALPVLVLLCHRFRSNALRETLATDSFTSD